MFLQQGEVKNIPLHSIKLSLVNSKARILFQNIFWKMLRDNEQRGILLNANKYKGMPLLYITPPKCAKQKDDKDQGSILSTF